MEYHLRCYYQPLFGLSKPMEDTYLFFTCSSLHLPPPLRPTRGTPLLFPFIPNARTVFMPREIRTDQTCTGRSKGDWVTSSLSKNAVTVWMRGPMQVPLITPSLLWLLLTLPLTDKTCWQRDLLISTFKVFPKDSLGQKYLPSRYFNIQTVSASVFVPSFYDILSSRCGTLS